MTNPISEAGKNFTLHTNTLVSDCRDVIMTRRRAQTFMNPWNKMSEADQQEEITSVTNLVEMLVRKAVDIVADNGFEAIYATLEDVSLKTGKATLKLANLDDPAVLMSVGGHMGKSVRLVVADDADFDAARTQMDADLDQPSLPAVEEADAENKAEPEDEHFGLAVKLVREKGKCNRSMIQKSLSVGLKKADELIAMMEAENIVTKADGKGKRTVILESKPDDDFPDKDELEDDGQGASGEAVSPEGAPSDPDGNPTPIGPDGEPMAPKAEGYQAGVSGKGLDENPFLEGSDDEASWNEGHGAALSDIAVLGAEGKKAFLEGRDSDVCSYKKGTDARMFWLRGFDKAEADSLKAETEDFNNDAGENDKK